MSLKGIDVSSAQGLINWDQAAAAGIEFAAIKLTEGVTYTNPDAPRDWAEAKRVGIRRIGYHYGLPAWNSPQDEAAHFLAVYQQLGADPGTLLSLDLEENQEGRTLPADCGPWALAWFQVAERPFNILGVLYTNLDLIQNHGLAAVGSTNRGLWLASLGNPSPPTPAPWPVLAIVQTSWTGSVPGVSGAVDIDAFEGDAAAFDRYAIPQDTPQPIDPRDAEIAQLQAQVADLTGQRDAAYKRLTDGLDLLPGLQAALQG